MPKLSRQDQFIDLSDYGRPAAILIANQFKDSRLTPIHLTYCFTLSGLLAVVSIFKGYYFIAGLFLILKSVLDAADGELSRVKNTPSYTGRYLDSIFDLIINLLIMVAIGYKSNTTLFYTLIAFMGIQLQGTLYNYYYVILRHNSMGGDTTSKIFEYKTPKALEGENQRNVNLLFTVFRILYGAFDSVIFYLDKNAYREGTIPTWFMTFVSLYGLGFQLIIISVMLFMNLIEYIIPFFIYYNILLIFIVIIRRYFLNNSMQNT